MALLGPSAQTLLLLGTAELRATITMDGVSQLGSRSTFTPSQSSDPSSW